MAEFDIPNPGEVCWRELRTNDMQVGNFYSQLFGWQLEQSKVTDVPYHEIVLGTAAQGGIMPMDENWGDTPSHWANYIAVANADETAQKITENGGAVHVPPFDAPGVGRMAMVADPSGANFAIIQFVAPE